MMEMVRSGKARGRTIAGLGVLAAIALASASSQGATELTVPGHAGHAWIAGNASCFSSPSFSNGIQNNCGSGQSWLIPIPVQTSSTGGAVNVNYYAGARNLGAGVPGCRYVVRSLDDSSGSLGSQTNVTGFSTPLGTAFGVSGFNNTQHLDCFFPAGPTNELTSFRIEF